ncbi:hypothetical protein ACLOJK_010616 [Asimina triloba]
MRNSRRAVLQTGPHAETSCVVLVVLAAGRKSHPRQTSLVGEMGRRKLVAKSSQIPYGNRSAQGDRDEGGNLRKAAHLPSSSPLPVLARISKTKNGETFLELDNGKTLLAKSIDIMCIKHLHTTKRLQSSTEGVEEGIQLRPSFHSSNAIPYSAPTILSNISKACQLRTVRLNSLAEGVKEGIQLRPSLHSNNIIPYPARTISSNISKACQLRKVRLAGLAEGVEEGIQRATVTKEDES